MSSSYLQKSVMGATANSQAIQCDYVILFDAGHEAAAKSYPALLAALKKNNLEVTTRPGLPKTKEILIFVRASKSTIHKALQDERIDDWLHGVFSTRPDPREQRDFAAQPVTASESLRVVYNLINSVEGAAIVPKQAPYEPVTAIFPPHDPEFNSKWLKSWTTFNKDTLVAIPDDQLTNIKNHFGESIALYFSFLIFYFSALVIPACVGLVTWISLGTYSIVYSIIVLAWSLVFVEGWRLRERMLAIRWGTYKVSNIGKERPEFKGTMQAQDQVHGGVKAVFPWYLRDLRILSSIPVLLLFAFGLALLIAMIFTSEVLINEVYDGKGKSLLSLLPTIAFAGAVPRVVGIWHETAVQLTKYENHKRDPTFEKSLVLKMFSLNAIVAFGTLTLTAYVYIPFGSLLVPSILKFLRDSKSVPETVSPNTLASGFRINSERLTNTLFALSTTTQAIGAFNEIVVPFVQRFITTKVNDRKEQKGELRNNDVESDDPTEKQFLERIRREASLPEYNTFLDYAEMVQQFGYVCLWSVAWPLCPVAALVNNFIELRGDAIKVCINHRRSAPKRAESIGPWLETLGALTWVAALTNASLVYMFQPRNGTVHTTYPQSHTTGGAINGTAQAFGMTHLGEYEMHPFHTTRIYQSTNASGSAYYNIRTTLFTALLVGLASERLYQGFRALAKHVLEELFWKQTEEAATLAKSEYQLKGQYISMMGLDKEVQPTPEKRNMHEPPYGPSESFWKRGDMGATVLQAAGKDKSA